ARRDPPASGSPVRRLGPPQTRTRVGGVPKQSPEGLRWSPLASPDPEASNSKGFRFGVLKFSMNPRFLLKGLLESRAGRLRGGVETPAGALRPSTRERGRCAEGSNRPPVRVSTRGRASTSR